MSDGPLGPAEVRALCNRILDEVEHAIVGKREAAELVLLGILAGGHVLLEDVPGVAKTLMVRSMCKATGMSYTRIQFTPDLMPADVTGSSFYDAPEREPRVPPRPAVRQSRPRGRDQPCATEDPVRHARSDAGTPGDG